MRLVLIGPPGCGKGTLSSSLVSEFGIAHISTGDMFREHIASGSEFGLQIKELISRGQLVSDEIVIGMVAERIARPDCQQGFLFDGFPRTTVQGESLEDILAQKGQRLTAVVLLEAHDDVLVLRTVNRRVCVSCGAVYHTLNKPTKVAGVCDACGSEVIQRPDDTESVIRQRLEVYRKSTEPLVKFYEDKGLLLRFNGELKASQVAQDVLARLKELVR